MVTRFQVEKACEACGKLLCDHMFAEGLHCIFGDKLSDPQETADRIADRL